MLLSNGTVVGLCYACGIGTAQLWVVTSAEEGTRRLWPEPRAISKMLAWSLVFTGPVAAAIWAFDRAAKQIDDNPGHGLHMSLFALLAIAWAVTALSTLAASGAKRIQQATGRNVFGERRLQPALIGAGIGMVLSGLYIFGPHLL